HSLRVVVQDVGLDGEDGIESVPVSAKIGDEDFHLTAGNAVADFLDSTGKDASAAVRLIVAIDACDDGITQAHARDGFGNTQRFVFIRRPSGFAGGNRAEAAGARANIAENHEGGGAMLPAFAHVGAAGRFANGMKVKGTHDTLEVVVAIAAKKLHAQPVRPRMGVRAQRQRRCAIGDDVEWRSHNLRQFRTNLFYAGERGSTNVARNGRDYTGWREERTKSRSTVTLGPYAPMRPASTGRPRRSASSRSTPASSS